MSGELLFLLVILVVVAIVGAWVRVIRKRRGNSRLDWDRFYLNPEIEQTLLDQQEQSAGEPSVLTTQESSKLELKKLQKLINDRKKIAWETDISYHVWSLYRTHFRTDSRHAVNALDHDGKWYELKTLKSSIVNHLKTFDFELSGVRYIFVDDEETHKITHGMRLFNLCLYDTEDRCLIDVPIKLRVDEFGKSYSISSDSPKAFILGNWINDFIKVSLKHQNIRNQEIRQQKHQERLREIEELKDKFGIAD